MHADLHFLAGDYLKPFEGASHARIQPLLFSEATVARSLAAFFVGMILAMVMLIICQSINLGFYPLPEGYRMDT